MFYVGADEGIIIEGLLQDLLRGVVFRSIMVLPFSEYAH